jgi:hypothetical protein
MCARGEVEEAAAQIGADAGVQEEADGTKRMSCVDLGEAAAREGMSRDASGCAQEKQRGGARHGVACTARGGGASGEERRTSGRRPPEKEGRALAGGGGEQGLGNERGSGLAGERRGARGRQRGCGLQKFQGEGAGRFRVSTRDGLGLIGLCFAWPGGSLLPVFLFVFKFGSLSNYFV